ncbi:MAG: hypothetical protein Kow00121_26670 [Elainellaceae cyanobacterium]
MTEGNQEGQRQIYTGGGSYREIHNQGTYVEGDYINLIIEGNYQLQYPDTASLSSTSRFFNYFRTLLFLVVVACVWLILGIFAQSAFPVQYAWEILHDSLFGAGGGSEALWRVVRCQQNQLVKSGLGDLEPESEVKRPKQRAAQLNRLDSRYWLVTKLIDLLAQGNSEKEWQVIAAEEALNRRRDLFADELEALKKEHYSQLADLQETWERITDSRAEREYRKIEQILDLLIRDFASRSRFPSRASVKRMLEEFSTILERNPKNIEPKRLKSLYKVWYLLDWVSRVADSDGKRVVQGGKYRAWSTDKVYHFNRRCKYYPDRVNSEEMERIICYDTREEAEQNHRACEICSRKSDKE